MNRVSCLSLWVAPAAVLFASVATAGDLIVNLGSADFENGVKPRAQQIIAASGNGLGHNSATDVGYDYHSFTAYFSASSSITKMASFSDDQVTVYITDTTTGESSSGLGGTVGQGVALEDIANSLVELNYQFTAGRLYSIRVEYKNIKYTGNGDIDGVVLFAYNGGGAVVPQVEIFVRAKRSGTADAWSSSAAVCAGGISSNAHTAEIEVRTTPSTPGYSITTSLVNGSGTSVGATLTIGSSTGSDGKISGTLISSDTVESATVVAGSSRVTIAFDWNVNPVWTISPEPLSSTNSSSLTLTHHDEAVNGHAIQFIVDRAQIVDGETGSVDDTNDASQISGVGHFDPDSASSDGGGGAATTLEVTGDENQYAIEFGLIASDSTVHDAAEFHPNAQVNGHPHLTRVVALADLGVQSADPDIELFGQAPTLTKPMLGTSPMDQAKVQPGQLITFKLGCLDQDSVTRTGQPKIITPFRTGAKYAIKIELTNAVFEGTTKIMLEFDESEVTTVNGNHPTNGKAVSQLTLDNVKIRVNADWAGGENNSVKVKVTVTDKTADSLPGYGGTVVDKPISFPLNWTKGTTADYPDNQSELKRVTLANGSLQVFYLYGADRNGAGNTAPNYQGITVNEEFADATSNLKAEWLTAATAMMHPDWGDADWAKNVFADTGNNVTFVIGVDDTTTDTHGANYSLLTAARQKLKPAFQNNELYYDQHQTFVCPPPQILGRYVIRRTQNPTNQSSVTKFADAAP